MLTPLPGLPSSGAASVRRSYLSRSPEDSLYTCSATADRENPASFPRAPIAFPCFGLCRASGCEYSLNVGSGNPRIVAARTFQSPLSSDACSIAASSNDRRPSACVCLPWRTSM